MDELTDRSQAPTDLAPNGTSRNRGLPLAPERVPQWQLHCWNSSACVPDRDQVRLRWIRAYWKYPVTSKMTWAVGPAVPAT